MANVGLTNYLLPTLHRAALAVNGYDPRFRRLLHALKTLLAVVLTIALLTRSDTQTRLFGAIAAAFLMQCVGAGSSRYQRNSMIIITLIMAALVALGASLNHLRPLQYSLLLIVAWATPEVRRRMPDHNSFALFCFTMTVLATFAASFLVGYSRPTARPTNPSPLHNR